MNSDRSMLSIEAARQIDLVDYLSKLGYQPSKIRNSDYWYLSPLRLEKTASFKVNKKLNCWYDHGLCKGGNIIDFAILYHNYTVADFLNETNNNLSFHPPLNNVSKPANEPEEPKLNIVRQRPVSSFSLQRYLHQRRIPLEVAAAFCKEVIYEVSGKYFYSIGFQNNSGGFELRNTFYKLSSSPKDITTFNNGAENVTVFEGFFDFLSFITMNKNQQHIPTDFLILNSVSFFEKARLFMEQHEQINLYLDHDKTGLNYTQYALSLSKKYKDESLLYKNYKDLNDWAMNFGKRQNRNLKL